MIDWKYLSSSKTSRFLKLEYEIRTHTKSCMLNHRGIKQQNLIWLHIPQIQQAKANSMLMPHQFTRKGLFFEVCACWCGPRSAALSIPTSPGQVLLHLLVQIIPVAALVALPLECRGSPSVNWPFFSLVLLFCILVRLLLLQ